MSDQRVRVTASLLDRLLDLDPRSPQDAVSGAVASVQEVKASVQRDLEELLNARNSHADLPREYVEAGPSVLAYGLPDFTILNLANPADQNRLRQHVERCIAIFETRLTGVTVTILPAAATDRTLRLRIEALLAIEPATEPVAWDVTIPHQTFQCEVRESGA